MSVMVPTELLPLRETVAPITGKPSSAEVTTPEICPFP